MAVTEQEYAALMQQVYNDMEKFGKLMPETSAAMALMKSGFSNALPAVNQFSKAAKDAGKLFTESANALGKNSAAMEDWSGAVDGAAGAAKGVATGMMLLSRVNPVVAFGLNKAADAAIAYAKASTSQSDRLFKTFQDISRFGGASAEGLQGVYRDAQRFGITTKELDKYVGLVAENSKELAALGGTVGQGLKDISAVSGAMEGYREGLYKAGMTQQEVNEGLMGYIRLQTRNGMIQRQTTEQLAAGAARYLVEQEALTKVTGATRKEQEANQRRLESFEQYNALILRLQNEGEEGVKKAALIKNIYGNIAAVSQTQADAFAAALSGNLQNEETQKQFRLTQGENLRIANDILNGTITDTGTAVGRLQGAVKTGIDTFGTQGQFGNFGKNFGDMRDAMSFAQAGAGDLGKALSKAAEDIDKSGVTGKKAQDAELERQAITTAAVNKGARALDDFTRLAVEPSTAVLKGFQRGMANLTTLLPGAGRTAAGGVPLFNTSGAGSAVLPTPPMPAPAVAPTGAPPAVAPAAPAAAKPSGGKPSAFAPGFNQQEFLKKMSAGGITDPQAQRNILAQIAAESGGVAKSENLNYTPDRLLKVFPKYIKDLDDARALIKQGPEAIANRVYGGRMGNTADEGYRYRGRGIIQLTGKSNYEKFGKMIGVDLVNNPDLANDPEVAQMLAVAYFKDKQQKGVNLSDIKQVGKAVGYVDIGGAETAKREQIARGITVETPQAADGAIFKGPKSGYAATLHGTEAVVPLDSNLTDTIKTLKDDFSTATAQILMTMQEMVRAQRDNVDVNRKMLVASQ